MYFTKVFVQSSDVYRNILNEMCRHERYTAPCGGECGECIVKNHVEGTKWLRSMGININVFWHGSVLPNRLSQWLISRRIKKVYSGYIHPFLVVYTAILTGVTIAGIFHHFVLP